jgi:ribosome-binding factor A
MQVVEMPKEYSRTQRIGDQMQRELSQLIQREIKDPRVGLVTVTAVEVSRDLSNAKVFVTVMGREADDATAVEESRKVLQGAAGFLRMQLGKAMQLRTVPQLRFHYDASIRRGVELSALIERAVAEDQQHGDSPDEPKE